MPATAHGLQGRFNARTVTKRKYPGSAPVPVEPALPHLWHGPVRSLSFTKTVFSEIRGHGGSVTQRVFLRIPGAFFLIFNLHEAFLYPGAFWPEGFFLSLAIFFFGPKRVALPIRKTSGRGKGGILGGPRSFKKKKLSHIPPPPLQIQLLLVHYFA